MPDYKPTQKLYTKSPPFVASFDSEDLLVGTQWAKYYLSDIAPATDVNLPTLSIVKEVIYANRGISFEDMNSVELDLDFDINFSQYTKLNGDFYTTIPLAIHNPTGGSVSRDISWTIKIYHVDASAVETQLGSTVTVKTTDASIPTITTVYFRRTALTVISDQVFQQNEKLRVSITSASTPDSTRILMAHDPKNRTQLDMESFASGVWDADVGSEAFILLPFDVER